jgi:hypothetical protein
VIGLSDGPELLFTFGRVFGMFGEPGLATCLSAALGIPSSSCMCLPGFFRQRTKFFRSVAVELKPNGWKTHDIMCAGCYIDACLLKTA